MPADQGRAGDGTPGPGGVIVAGGGVQGDPGAGADLVPDDIGAEEITAIADQAQFTHCQQSRQYGDADMTFGQNMAVMGIEGVDGGGTGKGGTGRGNRAPIKQQAHAVGGGGHLAGGMIARDLRDRQGRPRRSCANRIEKGAPGAGPDRFGSRQSRPQDEAVWRNGFGHGSIPWFG